MPYLEQFLSTMVYSTITYIECILIITIVMGIKIIKHVPKYDKDFIIILGCQIIKYATLTPLLKVRADKAIEFRNRQLEKTGKDLIFIPSGWQGSDGVISEAEAIKNYLLEKGINSKNILAENKSKNTFGNMLNSKKIIDKNMKNANIAFSTTNYHVFRSGIIATS